MILDVGIIPKGYLINNDHYLGESSFAYASEKPFSTVCRWNSNTEKFEYTFEGTLYSISHFEDIDQENTIEEYFLPVQKIIPINKKVLQTNKLQLV